MDKPSFDMSYIWNKCACGYTIKSKEIKDGVAYFHCNNVPKSPVEVLGCGLKWTVTIKVDETSVWSPRGVTLDDRNNLYDFIQELPDYPATQVVKFGWRPVPTASEIFKVIGTDSPSAAFIQKLANAGYINPNG